MCHTFGVFKLFQFIFQKTRINDCFKFSILDLDICLNGISIVVVINSWLIQCDKSYKAIPCLILLFNLKYDKYNTIYFIQH